MPTSDLLEVALLMPSTQPGPFSDVLVLMPSLSKLTPLSFEEQVWNDTTDWDEYVWEDFKQWNAYPEGPEPF